MNALSQTDSLFFAEGGLDPEETQRNVREALAGAEDGELFLEYTQSEGLVWDDGRLRSASFDVAQGFGLRAVAGERSGYAHSSVLSQAALKRAGETVRAVHSGYEGRMDVAPQGTNRQLYPDDNPLQMMPFAEKVALLERIDAHARALDPRVRQVSVSLAGSWQAVQILRADGTRVADIRPLIRLNVSVVVEKDGRMESGSYGAGGRESFLDLLRPESWQHHVDEALRQALVQLDARPAPAGEMTVVLGPGWPGILLHEAIGHGLEGDFYRKGTSAFAGLVGQRIASPGVTIVDDGTIAGRRGALTVDDEGTPSQTTTLIEDGILTGFIYDRLNARLTGNRSTGNGRRQDYAHAPMPRMTNTIMQAGERDPQEILASVKNGLYAVNFGGGQVDITNGKFVFSASEAYLIEDGKVTAPVKGATLIGNGADALTRIAMVGNDFSLDPGIGTCGKEGQGVPVGVGQPTLRLDGLTVGGTGG